MTTDDGVTVLSNSDTQEELEASVAPIAEPTPSAEPDAAPRDTTGKFQSRGKKRDDPVTRMADATAKEAAAKRERDEAISERDRLRAELATRQAAPPQAAPLPLPPANATDWQRYQAMPTAPKQDQFTKTEDWLVAMNLFVADTRYAELRAVEQGRAADTQRVEVSQSRARTVYDKITLNGTDTDVLNQISPSIVNTPPMSALPRGVKPTFGNFIIEQAFKSDHPREILLHLSNEQEVQRLAMLPPDEVVRSLALFDANVSRTSAAPTGTAAMRSVSQAKPVFKPVAGSAQTPTGDEPPGDDASDAAHDAYWAKQRRKYR